MLALFEALRGVVFLGAEDPRDALFTGLFFGLQFDELRADELRDVAFGVVFGACFGFGADALRVGFFVPDDAAGRLVVVVVVVVTPFAVLRFVTIIVTVPLFFAVLGAVFFVAMF